MRCTALILLAFLGSGCTCAIPAATTALGIAGTIVANDPTLLIVTGPEFIACASNPRVYKDPTNPDVK